MKTNELVIAVSKIKYYLSTVKSVEVLYSKTRTADDVRILNPGDTITGQIIGEATFKKEGPSIILCSNGQYACIPKQYFNITHQQIRRIK